MNTKEARDETSGRDQLQRQHRAARLPRGIKPQAADRLRFQLAFVVLFSVALPALLVGLLFEEGALASAPAQISLLASGFAGLTAVAINRQIAEFPGVKRVENEFPSLMLCYGLIFFAVLLLRLEYSRVILFAGFGFSLLGLFLLVSRRRKAREGHFWIVPFGNVDRVRQIDAVAHKDLEQPILPETAQRGIVADLRSDLPDDWERMLTSAVLRGVQVFHVKQLEEALTGKVDIEHLSENTLGALSPDQAYLGFKQVSDFVLSLAVLPFLIPILAVAAALIKIDSRGPILFRQERVGQRGDAFRVIKFRTMADTSGAAKANARESAITQAEDKRITRVGKYLRRYRIDELPQVFNVLAGQMSWIGPRPEAMPLSEWYSQRLPFYAYRHIVKPGITGWAQVNQGHVADLESVHDKLRYDFYYIKNFSIWLDLLIVARTIRVVFDGFGSK